VVCALKRGVNGTCGGCCVGVPPCNTPSRSRMAAVVHNNYPVALWRCQWLWRGGGGAVLFTFARCPVTVGACVGLNSFVFVNCSCCSCVTTSTELSVQDHFNQLSGLHCLVHPQREVPSCSPQHVGFCGEALRRWRTISRKSHESAPRVALRGHRARKQARTYT